MRTEPPATTFELIDLCTRLDDIEGMDNDETGIGSKVADCDKYTFYIVLVDSGDVVFRM